MSYRTMMAVAAMAVATRMGVKAQNNWMERLDDNRMLAALTLPGTHDAATAEGWSGLGLLLGDIGARAQDLTIAEQWAVGVRVFDLRPQKDGNVLRCMHGVVGTSLLVGDFFAKLRDLLAASPSELAIVTTKIDTTEGEPEVAEWAPLFDALIHSDSLRHCFVAFKPTMTVGDVRGKILLLARNKYADTPLGGFITGWSSDKDFALQQSGVISGLNGYRCPLWVQDYFQPNADREGKEQAIRLMLDAAMNRSLTGQRPAWVMNYTAGNTRVFLSDGYRENAVYAHQLVLDYLADESHDGSAGIVFMDYAGVDQSKSTTGNEVFEVKGLQLVQALIAQNFRNEATALTAPDYADATGAWHTLDGRRVATAPFATGDASVTTHLPKGIYIHNGRKVVVR